MLFYIDYKLQPPCSDSIYKVCQNVNIRISNNGYGFSVSGAHEEKYPILEILSIYHWIAVMIGIIYLVHTFSAGLL